MTSPSPVSMERLAQVGASHVCDVRGGEGALDGGIRPVWRGPSFAGPARTVIAPAGHNAAVRAAAAEAQPGEVLVVSGAGFTSRAVVGDLIGRRLLEAGVIGVIVDGAVRDVAGFEMLGLPVYARATCPAGPLPGNDGETQVIVGVGGQVVRPGDVVVADADGVAIIPAEELTDVATRADAAEQHERQFLEATYAH
ncbi:RraA family protein [Aeromicrobium massiliense]|uniref:RraA family protein n=1 Tax=Aeromicrobium massiliense TaxID=1464554 RepID=UPI0009DB5806|nr:hypothetical protein [Aeromicrobium massiliense]